MPLSEPLRDDDPAPRTANVTTPRDQGLAPSRSAPFDEEPGYYEAAQLWLFGNVRLLSAILTYVPRACGPCAYSTRDLDLIEREAEDAVLSGKILVCGVHSPAHQRAAIVPLRWGSPRIVVMSGGFRYHLGERLDEEPFRQARLWRYRWDPLTDLAVSRRAPEKKPTFSHHNPTVDRLIAHIAGRERSNEVSVTDPLNLRVPK